MPFKDLLRARKYLRSALARPLTPGFASAIQSIPAGTWKVLIADSYSQKLLESAYVIDDILRMNVTCKCRTDDADAQRLSRSILPDSQRTSTQSTSSLRLSRMSTVSSRTLQAGGRRTNPRICTLSMVGGRPRAYIRHGRQVGGQAYERARACRRAAGVRGAVL